MSQDVISALIALIPFGVIGAIRHGAWLFKLLLSSRWRDIKATGELPYKLVGAAMTVKGEPPETFQKVLDSLLRERIDQVCITFDQGEHDNMALTDRFAQEHAGEIDVRWEIVYEKGKRKGLKAAIAMVEGMDIIICMDSDTIFGEGVKQSILETFSKPGIGGVTVKQRVYQPSNLMHHLFDIRLKLRYHIEAPGQAVGGYMSCLSGRCSAYLAGPLKEISANLINEQWLGIRKTGGGEDKCLTTFLQDAGYKTAVIVDSEVYTRPESSVRVYISQSLRWARNSWFSDLRAIFQRKPWMVRNPVMMFYTLDRMMSTFTLALAIWYMSILILTQHYLSAGILATWWILSRGIKIYPYLLETKRFWVVPAYSIFSIFLSVVKVHALVTLWETGWLTRGAGQKAKDLSKMLLTNAYRGATAVLMVVLGVVAFRSQDVWMADIPGVAEAGHFYRPGQDGLEVLPVVFGEQRTTFIAIADPTDLNQLNAALPDIVRMGEEITRQADFIRVVKTSSLTEAEVEISNLIAVGRPPAEGYIASVVASMYDYPRQGDRLMDTEPFAETGEDPIRIARAPWDVTDVIVLAGADPNQMYRLRGQILNVEGARAMMEQELGTAFFQTVSTGGPASIRLEQLDHTIDTTPDESGQFQRQYTLIVTNNIDPAQLTLHIDSASLPLLQNGTPITVTLNGTFIGILMLDPSAAQPLTISLAPAAEIVAANPQKPLVLSLSFPASAMTNPEVAVIRLWQQVDAYATLSWGERQPEPFSLASYPFPFLSMQTATPTAIIIPDAPTEAELNQLVRLVAFLGANGHPSTSLRVMTPSALDEDVLMTANIIVLGSVQRQALSDLLSRQANQLTGVGIDAILPTLDSGFIWTSDSPWNSDRHMIVATGATEPGAHLAALALERTTLLIDTSVMGAIVRADDTLVPFWGYDQIALAESIITDVLVAKAAIPGDSAQ
ncbi:MAG: glycosyltransferase [Anaerolineae bacterium]|nr:glycosyltransferase [Anaerolineae bacterium]